MTNEEVKKVLKLTLKKKWFDLMCAGFKKIEFREPSDWIYSRLLDKNGDAKKYDLIEFKNGYSKNAPCFCCEFLGWDVEEKQTEYIFGGVKIISEVGMIKIFLGKIL
jgi:hypothetical protein